MGGNDNFTKVLLHFDGANNSTSIIDSNAGGAAKTWTNHTGSITTTQSKFGGASYDATSGGWVDTPDSTDFTVGSGAFTMDLWFYRSGGDGTIRGLAGQDDNTGGASIAYTLGMDASNHVYAIVTANGTTQVTVTGSTAFTTTGWHHAALVRTGNTLKLFVDGTQEGGDITFSGSVFDSTKKFSVGAFGELVASNTWVGYIDEFRLSIGIARWTANFTTPIQAYY